MDQGPYRGASAGDPDEPPVDPHRPWALQTWTSRLLCPKCGISLFAARKEGYRVDACGTCGGAWLDHATAARAVSEQDLTPAQLSEQASRHAKGVVSLTPRPCPVCRDTLRQRLVPEAPVVLDVCDAHGSWFDPDELRRFIEALVRANPPPPDPEVEEAIRREALLGQFRPPESYEPGGDDLSIWHVLTVLFRLR